MLGFLIPLLIVGAFVAKGIKNANRPPKPDMEREWLRRLKNRSLATLSLDHLEDGVVLARRYGDKPAEAIFERAVLERKLKRLPI